MVMAMHKNCCDEENDKKRVVFLFYHDDLMAINLNKCISQKIFYSLVIHIMRLSRQS